MDNNNQINIELSEEVAVGTYANLAVISHSSSEFVMDFIQLMPNMPQAKVRSRIIMTPQNAKRLLRALTENISRYEAQMGRIPEDNTPIPPMNFGGGPASA